MKPKISIITPTHDTKHLLEAVNSVLAQTFQDWEMHIVGNGPVNNLAEFKLDPRIHLSFYSGLGNIGAIKNHSFKLGNGELLLELDHDDILTPDCLEEVWRAYEEQKCDFLYSNDALFDKDNKPIMFDPRYGWRYRPFEQGKFKLQESVAFKMCPSTLSHINTAPDHVRVWRREFYHAIGGHNSELKILDDYDLICRTYIAGTWYHLDKCLYIYRHYDNSWNKLAQERHKLDWPVYEKHIVNLIQRWAGDRNLPLIDICSWKNPRPGFIGVDITAFPGVLQADLNGVWPFEDSSVGCVAATDALEHLTDKHHTMSEIYRVLAPGGYLLSYTPHGLSEGYISDPTHKTPWNLRTFDYYDHRDRAQYINNTTIRFRPMWTLDTVLSPDLRYVTYHAMALKGGEEELESRGARSI